MESSPYILGLESSCDETSVALVDRRGHVLVNAVASQIDLHRQFGGVVPEVAARRHIETFLPMIETAFAEASEKAGRAIGWDDIEAIAATYAPGLIGCLLIGVETAKALAWRHGKPLIATHHLKAHLHAPFLHPGIDGAAHLLIEGGKDLRALPFDAGRLSGDDDAAAAENPSALESRPTHAGAVSQNAVAARASENTGEDARATHSAPASLSPSVPSPSIPSSPRPPAPGPYYGIPSFPHVGLIVSGGHTSLALVEAPGVCKTIATTRDDAVGEAYDKVARVMGLGFPGGPVIDKLAAQGDPKRFPFTPPMMRRDMPDFSFSGLKTAVARKFAELGGGGEAPLADDVLRDLCAGFQAAAIDALLTKAVAAARRHGVRDLLIVGGVASNRGLRAAAREAAGGLRVWFPHFSLCTDNAGMIAGLAWHVAPLGAEEALELNPVAVMGLG